MYADVTRILRPEKDICFLGARSLRSLVHDYKFQVVMSVHLGGASNRVASFGVLGARPQNLPTDKSIIIVQT